MSVLALMVETTAEGGEAGAHHSRPNCPSHLEAVEALSRRGEACRGGVEAVWAVGGCLDDPEPGTQNLSNGQLSCRLDGDCASLQDCGLGWLGW